VLFTEWKPFDPLIAIAVAINILWSGGHLVRQAVRGLMDLPDPERAPELQALVQRIATEMQVGTHRLRFRDTGQRTIMSVHLLFPDALSIGEAHARATRFEERVAAEAGFPVEVLTHLEAIEDHDRLHPGERPF
jgi:divalent metal cation (Fe/Co/Zn/Cd) transporter